MRAPAVGVRAWCVSRVGLGMETEYVSFAPPRVAAVKITRGPRVTFRYFLEFHPRWMDPLLEPWARRWFSWETQRRVRALAASLRGPAPGPPSRT